MSREQEEGFIGPTSRAPTSGQKTRVFGHRPDAVVSRWSQPRFWLAAGLYANQSKKLQLLATLHFWSNFCLLFALPHFPDRIAQKRSSSKCPSLSLLFLKILEAKTFWRRPKHGKPVWSARKALAANPILAQRQQEWIYYEGHSLLLLCWQHQRIGGILSRLTQNSF